MKKEKAKGTSRKPIMNRWFLVVATFFVICIVGCTGDSGKERLSDKLPETPDQVTSESTSSTEDDSKIALSEFFSTIGTDVKRADIEDIAKSFDLYINHKNNGVGIYTYRIASDKGVANINYPEKGSYVTVSFDGLNDDEIKEITYFDEERMVAGYWNKDTGYLLADYNYPQIVYLDEESGKAYSRMPVDSADEIINYSFNGNLDENFLETLFISITPDTKKDDIMNFINEHALSYNSRGAGNEEIISYCYEIGEKYGENGSYITFDTDSNGLITRMEYRYYPANYRNGYSACFYNENYAEKHSVPQGFVLKTSDGSEEYLFAEELIAQLHKQ